LPVFIALACFEQDYLYRLQELNLFMHTPLFFRQCMVTAGGLLTWAGAYLTQYLYYPVLGAGVLCLMWAFLVALLNKTFRIPAAWSVVTLIPIACLVVSITDLGYWIFYLKLRGHVFDATVGTIVAVGLAWIYRLLPARLLRTLWVAVVGIVGYPLFGFYGLFAVALMGILGRRWIDGLVAVVVIAGVPLICYHTLYHETNLVNIYWTALPVFWHLEKQYFAYSVPYLVLFVSIALMAIGGWWMGKSGWRRAVGFVILVAVVACTSYYWYKDDNFHRELAMSRSIGKTDWEGVVRTADKVRGEPTRAICMMRNVALARLGRQGDEMFRYQNGAKRAESPFPVQLVHTEGKMLYLQYGLPNYCYRWCMEDGVEYGWNVEKLKLMVKCSLLNKEFVAAQKFINMLKKTDFHATRARHYEEYIRNPQLMTSDQELVPIMRLMQNDNFLTADQAQMERFLIEHFTYAEGSDPLLQEQVLIASLQSKDMALFWKQFYQYTQLHPGVHVPIHYQEAACLFGHLGNIDVSHMPFDPAVVQDYENFVGLVGKYRQQGKSMDEIRPLVYDLFHTTYYYDFYFNHYNYVEN